MFERGDIVAVNFPYTDGNQSKERPAVVISNTQIAETGDIVIVMISSKNRTDNTSVELTANLITHPMPRTSFVRCHRLFTVTDKLLLAKYSSVNAEGMKQILGTVVSIIS